MQEPDGDEKRWYIIRLPKTTLKAGEELEREMSYRRKKDLSVMEYFAPEFVEMKEIDGNVLKKKSPFCLNYVFLYSTLEDILDFRKDYPKYNLIKDRMESTNNPYLFVPEKEMKIFMIMARAYKNIVPFCQPEEVKLSKGDKVRIIGGPFSGIEGILLSQNGSDGGKVIINVCNCLAVPTLSIQPEYIKILSFASGGKHIYKKFDNYQPKIRRALRHYFENKLDATDRKNVTSFISRFNDVEIPSRKMLGKYYTLMMMSHRVLGNNDEIAFYAKNCISSISDVTNVVTRAYIFSALYACTKENIFHEEAKKIIATWESDSLSDKKKNIIDDLRFFSKEISS